MKRLAAIVVAAVVVAAGLFAYMAARVSVTDIRGATEERIEALTGFDVQIRGPTTISYLPLPAFEIRNVALARPGTEEGRAIASIEVLRGTIALLPMISGRAILSDLELVRPRIRLTVDRHGQPNWIAAPDGEPADQDRAAEDSSGADAAPPAADTEPDTDPDTRVDTMPAIADRRFGNVTVSDGAIVYVNQHSGLRREISSINAKISWSRLAAPLQVAGSLIWNGEAVRFTLASDTPLDFLRGGASPTRLTLESGVVNAVFKGAAHYPPDPQIEGDMKLSAPSVRSLFRWIGTDLGPGPGLEALDLSGKLNLIGDSAAVSDLALTLDGNAAQGSLKMAFGDRRTELQGTLAFEALDLGVYRTPPAPGEAPMPPAAALAVPVDLSMLDRIAADIRVSAASVAYGDFKFGRSAGTLTVRKGGIDLGVGEATLYGGTAQGTVSLAPIDDGAQFKSVLKLAKTDVGPLLTALTGAAPIAGATSATINLSGKGRTVGDIVASLSGDAKLSIGPGSIEGIDVGKLVAALETGVVEGWPATPTKTVIDQLTAKFAVSGGNAATDDFHMKGPNIEVQADGEIRLVAASLAGHGTADLGAASDKANTDRKTVFSVPFVIEGPIANPVLYPDPIWLMNRDEATPDEVERFRKDLQQKRPEDVVEDLVKRGLDRLPKLPADNQSTTPQQ